MDALTRDEGIATDSFSASCALRMRVSISAIGSLMLMLCLLSPAGFGHAGNFAAHGDLAQLVAPQAKLAVHAARAPRQLAAVAHPRRAGVARQLLQLHARCHALVLRCLKSLMMASSAARLTSNFFTVLRRFSLRLMTAVFAMAQS